MSDIYDNINRYQKQLRDAELQEPTELLMHNPDDFGIVHEAAHLVNFPKEFIRSNPAVRKGTVLFVHREEAPDATR